MIDDVKEALKRTKKLWIRIKKILYFNVRNYRKNIIWVRTILEL